MKKLGMAIVAISLMVGLSVTTFGASGPRIVLDSKEIITANKPFMTSGRTFVPLRVVSENMGAKVDWNSSIKEIAINKGYNLITLRLNYKTARVNNKIITLDAVAQLKDSVTYVPLRFVSEALGAKVMYDSPTSTVYITTDGSTPVVVKPKEPEYESVDKYGNAFKGKLATDLSKNAIKEVKVISQSNFPIEVAGMTVYSITSDGKTFTVRAKKENDWDTKAPVVYLSDKDGINRGRDAIISETKNADGTVTGKYPETGLSDYVVDGDNFENYKLANVKYFVFIRNGDMVAIPASEVIK